VKNQNGCTDLLAFLGRSAKQIEQLSKGDFRIPDVTILTIKAAEIIEMRMSVQLTGNAFILKK
jgi:uncharacterized protein YdeI (BOF family)